MELSDIKYGIFKIKSEVILLLMHKLSLTEEEVVGELCTLVNGFISKPRKIVKVNSKGWNVQRNKVTLANIPLYLSISVQPNQEFMSIKISIVDFSHERYYSLSSIKETANKHVSSKLEKLIGE